MFTFLVANIISPGVYANTFLRLKINDDELFPNACKRANRIDPNDPKLSFAMCNNIDLVIQRTVAVINSAIVIAKALFTGGAGDVWQDIQNAWNIPKVKFHKMFIDQKEGDWGVMVDVSLNPLFPAPIFPWKVIKDHDKLCVATVSFAGWIPIGCKYIKEPFPKSIYSDFIDLSPDPSNNVVYDPNHLTSCSGSGGCYQSAYSNSKTSIVMSGPLVECVKTMIAKLMISPDVCSLDDAQAVLGSSARTSSSLFQFQVNMHKTVAALLTIYVILFGAKIVLSGDIPEKAQLVNFVLKFLFVIYFSIGININPGSGNDLDRMDGLIEWVFPFLLGGMTQMASWVISASPSELCTFAASEYPLGMEHIALWDALDCRVSHYIGLDILQTVAVNNAMMNHDYSSMDILSFPIPPYLYLLIPAVISGNMTLVMLALMYPLMVISVAAFVVNATIVCMICIVVLGVLAPLFVPMLLFEYTKGYFDSYVKLMISFMLQPMVVVTFMTTMLSVYDFGFYGTCKYTSGTFSDGSRTAKVFFVDNDWSLYTEDDAKGCVNSLGFILNNPLAFLFGTVDISKATFPGQDDPTRKVEEQKFPFLESIQPSPGLIFSTIEILYEKIRTLIISFLTAIFTLYLLYHFSEQLAEFAADMTEGVSIGNMSIKPQTLQKAGMAAMSAGRRAIGKAGGGGGATDKAATGGASRATDKAAAGGGTARDKVGTGGGAKGKAASGSEAAKDTASKSESKADNKQHQWKSARPTALQGSAGTKDGGKSGG
jgi:type IV secretion system protein VirB6